MSSTDAARLEGCTVTCSMMCEVMPCSTVMELRTRKFLGPFPKSKRLLQQCLSDELHFKNAPYTCTLKVSLMVHKSSDCDERLVPKILPENVACIFFLQTIALSLQFYFVIPVISLLVATNLFVKML